MISVETYAANQQHGDYSAVSILTNSRVGTHRRNNNRKQSAARAFATNLKRRVVPKQKCGSEKKSCCDSVCERLCSCLMPNMLASDEAVVPEPLVTNGQVDRRRVCINIAGKRYETYESTLAKYPETLLALPQRELFYDSLNGEYFFDRNRKAFGSILTYCQTGVLVKPPNLDERIFAAELRFFGFELESQAHLPQTPASETEHILPENEILKKIWQLFEFPDTSLVARVVSLFSMSVILLSIVMFCLETLPEFKTNKMFAPNGTVIGKYGSFRTKKVYEPVFFTVESACIAWFTLEYLLRLIASPKKFFFIYQPLNMIDLVAIIPFYITLVLSQTDTNVSSLSILRVLRLVRVFRIFKLSRYSKGLKILGYTFRASLQELGLLAFFLLIGIILFASAAYYCEEQVENTKFESIIHGFWWAIVTMTTVGYGDMYPETLGGKLVGSFCVLVGVLAIAFPVPVIVNNFTYYYTLEQGAPEPLDEEYLETPLGNNRNSYLSSVSVTTSDNEDDDDPDDRVDDFNKNTTSKRKTPNNGTNGMITLESKQMDEDAIDKIHYQVESPV